MEKRIVLSFVLSFLVIIIWQSLFSPSPQEVITKNSQIVENKQVTNVLKSESLFQESEEVPLTNDDPEEFISIANSSISAEFSTYGGVIKRATILQYDAQLPVTNIFSLKQYNDLIYNIDLQNNNEVVFRAKKDGLTIIKTYRLSESDFIINAAIEIKNIDNVPVSFNPSIQALLIDVNEVGEELTDSRDRNLMEYSVLSEGKVFRKTGAYKFEDKEKKSIDASAQWFGFRNRYFCTIVKPDFDVQGYEFLPKKEKNQLKISGLLPEKILNVGDSLILSSLIYVGPQNSSILKQYDADLEKIQVYFRAGFFDAIAKIIEDLIKLVYKVIPNWGVAILLVSMFIYLAMYPMTMKSMMSMRKMQSLQPRIVELREKHEKNPQKLNQEIMKLYAENKVNPLGGCLPLLLQMPVFICLYQMIWRSVLFKGADFLWIKDLSQPDRLFILPQKFPIIGNEINLLPIISVILMFIQQKMTAKNMASSDPNQRAQQKMMAIMMPVVLLLVFYRIASGLTLYLTVFYVLSSFTQWRVSRKAAAEA